MATILLITRLVLAAVFAVAGLAKLADRDGTRQTMTDFGVPSALIVPLGLLLPSAELAIAAALIPTSTALWGAVAALALLLVFVGGIAANLARGKKPDCHCFGQLHSAPAGWKTLGRNGVLVALAGFSVWQAWQGNVGPSAVGWIGALSASQLLVLVGGIVVLGLLAGQWWFLLHLFRQNGRLLLRVEALEKTSSSVGAPAPSPNGASARPAFGLPVGSSAPTFALEGLHGEKLTLDSLRAADKPVVLLFTDPGCGPCNALLPEIGRWQKEHSERLAITLISRGSAEENRAKASEHGVTGVLLQDDWEVSEAYKVTGTPSAVVVRPDGTVGSPVVAGSEAIKDLVSRAVRAPDQLLMRPAAEAQPCPNCGKVHPNGGAAQRSYPAAKKIGEPAPQITLADLGGKTVDLEQDFGGEETLVLFWNPGCGFCQRMLPELKEWEERRPENAPQLLVVSAGPKEANAAMGLSSTVVLDQGFGVGRSFGASGTPSAVLVDAEGRVASEVAVGAPGVLELAGVGRDQA